MLSIDHYEMDSASIQALQRNMKGLKEILLLRISSPSNFFAFEFLQLPVNSRKEEDQKMAYHGGQMQIARWLLTSQIAFIPH